MTNISRHGFWLLAGDEELFVAFDEFPWFRNARLSDVFAVEQPGPDHFRWTSLDVDLTGDSIRHPERYPLLAAQGDAAVHEPDHR